MDKEMSSHDKNNPFCMMNQVFDDGKEKCCTCGVSAEELGL